MKNLITLLSAILSITILCSCGQKKERPDLTNKQIQEIQDFVDMVHSGRATPDSTAWRNLNEMIKKEPE